MIRRIMKFFTSMSSMSWPKSREKALKVFYRSPVSCVMGKKYPPPKSGNFRDSSLVTGSQPLRLKENTSLVNTLKLQIKAFSTHTAWCLMPSVHHKINTSLLMLREWPYTAPTWAALGNSGSWWWCTDPLFLAAWIDAKQLRSPGAELPRYGSINNPWALKA